MILPAPPLLACRGTERPSEIVRASGRGPALEGIQIRMAIKGGDLTSLGREPALSWWQYQYSNEVQPVV